MAHRAEPAKIVRIVYAEIDTRGFELRIVDVRRAETDDLPDVHAVVDHDAGRGAADDLVWIECRREIAGELGRVLRSDLIVKREVPVVDIEREPLDRLQREPQVVVFRALRIEVRIAFDGRDEASEI